MLLVRLPPCSVASSAISRAKDLRKQRVKRGPVHCLFATCSLGGAGLASSALSGAKDLSKQCLEQGPVHCLLGTCSPGGVQYSVQCNVQGEKLKQRDPFIVCTPPVRLALSSVASSATSKAKDLCNRRLLYSISEKSLGLLLLLTGARRFGIL